MKESITRSREILAESHIAAIAIAILVVWSLDSAFRALWGPIWRVLSFLLTGIAILDVPHFSPTLTIEDRVMWITTFYYLYSAIVSFSTAWLMSHWVYGDGPFRTLMSYVES